MSQRNVQQVIGRLVTDEAFRHRFEESPGAALAEMIVRGLELTSIELLALASIDRSVVARFAEAIDPNRRHRPSSNAASKERSSRRRPVR